MAWIAPGRGAWASSGPDKQWALLSKAFNGAVAEGRPLLVIVIPDSESLQRGVFWGEVLTYSTQEQLARFGRCELVCATVEDLRRLLPWIGDDPWMVLVKTGDRGLSSLEWTLEPPPVPTLPETNSSELTHWDARYEDWLLRKQAGLLKAFELHLGEPLGRALGARRRLDAAQLAARARRQRKSRDSKQQP